MKTKQNKHKSNSRVNILFWHNVFLDTLKYKTSEKSPFSTGKLTVCKKKFKIIVPKKMMCQIKISTPVDCSTVVHKYN